MHNKKIRRIFQHTRHSASSTKLAGVDLASLLELGTHEPGSAQEAMEPATPSVMQQVIRDVTSAPAVHSTHDVTGLFQRTAPQDSGTQSVSGAPVSLSVIQQLAQPAAPIAATDPARAIGQIYPQPRRDQAGSAASPITSVIQQIVKDVTQPQTQGTTSPSNVQSGQISSIISDVTKELTQLSDKTATNVKLASKILQTDTSPQTSEKIAPGTSPEQDAPRRTPALSNANLFASSTSSNSSGANNATSTLVNNLTSGRGTALPDALSQAVREITQLRTVSQNQAAAILANTQAISQNTSAKSASGILGSAGNFASSLLGDTLSFLPVVSGLMHLFGGGSPAPPQSLPVYTPPNTLQFQGALGQSGAGTAAYNQYGNAREATAGGAELIGLNSILQSSSTNLQSTVNNLVSSPTQNSFASGGTPPAAQAQQPVTPAPQITVQVQALDSRSFLDRSSDIAQAVREAMLNLHSINDVVNDL